MNRRFLLMKDSPEFKAGAIVEQVLPDTRYRVISDKWNQIENKYEVKYDYSYNKDVVETQPQWWQEVSTIYVPLGSVDSASELLVKNGVRVIDTKIIEERK